MKGLKIKNVKQIDHFDWNSLVCETYKRVYDIQQQDGCRSRGSINITVPVKHPEDFENDIIPEEVKSDEMGVSFKAWLERDPKQKLTNPDDQEPYCLDLWWERNFYPNLDMIINDLYSKGLLEAGEYEIKIDW